MDHTLHLQQEETHLPETSYPELLPCIRHQVSQDFERKENSGTEILIISVRKHGPLQSARMGIDIPRLHGNPLHHPHLRLLLERSEDPGEV